VSNVHLEKEGHDFGKNKRDAVYDFFIRTFKLNSKMLDESKVTKESEEQLRWNKKNKSL
jgi:LPS O-antigen subunit length determinant protein (WzzB/FepE family)